MTTLIAQNLTHARTHYKRPDGRCGLTQIELAQQTGLTDKAISAIETGAIEHPQRLTVARLAVALDTTVEVLLGEPPPGPRKDGTPGETLAESA